MCRSEFARPRGRKFKETKREPAQDQTETYHQRKSTLLNFQTLAGKCLNHETAAIAMTSREIFSQNRKQIQKLFRSLDQLITPNSLNYDDI